MRIWLKSLRKNKGYTQAEVAEVAGISRCFYTQIESSQQKGLHPNVAIRIAKVLRFDWTWFYQEALIPKASKEPSDNAIQSTVVRQGKTRNGQKLEVLSSPNKIEHEVAN